MVTLHYKDLPRVCHRFIRAMTHESTTEPFTITTVIEEEQEDVAEYNTDALSDKDSTPCHLFGTVCPKEEIVFMCQVKMDRRTEALVKWYGYPKFNSWINAKALVHYKD